MNTENIAIHESSNSDRVIKFLPLTSFSETFQAAYANGDIYGVYFEGEEIVAQTNGSEVLTAIEAR